MTKKKKVFVEYFINPALHQNIFYCTSLKKLILALAKYKYIFFPPLTIIVKWWIVKIYVPAYAYIKRIFAKEYWKVKSMCL